NNSNVEDFSQAITALQTDRIRLNTMQQSAANMGLQFTIEKFVRQISAL
ncbi:putative glycosyltransferase, partial [Bacteroides fragilis str. S13 L11]